MAEREGFEPDGVIRRISNLLIDFDLRSPSSLSNPQSCHETCHQVRSRQALAFSWSVTWLIRVVPDLIEFRWKSG